MLHTNMRLKIITAQICITSCHWGLEMKTLAKWTRVDLAITTVYVPSIQEPIIPLNYAISPICLILWTVWLWGLHVIIKTKITNLSSRCWDQDRDLSDKVSRPRAWLNELEYSTLVSRPWSSDHNTALFYLTFAWAAMGLTLCASLT